VGTKISDMKTYRDIVLDQLARKPGAEAAEQERLLDDMESRILSYIENNPALSSRREKEIALAKAACAKIREEIRGGVRPAHDDPPKPPLAGAVVDPPANRTRTAAASARSAPRPAPRGLILALALASGLAGGIGGAWLMRPQPPGFVGDDRVIGQWAWSNGVTVELQKNGAFLWDKEQAGYFFRTGPNSLIMIHRDGRAVDYLTADADFRNLRGYTARGDAISAARR
jgi:hypothetical protein